MHNTYVPRTPPTNEQVGVMTQGVTFRHSSCPGFMYIDDSATWELFKLLFIVLER